MTPHTAPRNTTISRINYDPPNCLWGNQLRILSLAKSKMKATEERKPKLNFGSSCRKNAFNASQMHEVYDMSGQREMGSRACIIINVNCLIEWEMAGPRIHIFAHIHMTIPISSAIETAFWRHYFVSASVLSRRTDSLLFGPFQVSLFRLNCRKLYWSILRLNKHWKMCAH